ncbi:hypothetical protein QTO30_12640 [Yoonia sp. GPGPB17]|uniref:helix-turn-helix transcriptional regulator n=1 Tax=Yoonia sp. GPGPB17 TaxID=3026147 RepID=UPI0030C5987C
MTQTHYDQGDQSQKTDILLALYETVFAPEKFLTFLTLLENALSHEAAEQVFGPLERPTEDVLQKLIAEERKMLPEATPWLTASDLHTLQSLLVQKGFVPYPEDIGFLSKGQDTKASVVRLVSADEDIDWIIVARGAYALEAYGMPQNWETFLRHRFKAQFAITDAELDVLVGFARGADLRMIAENRGSSYNTVRNQIRSAMDKSSAYLRKPN